MSRRPTTASQPTPESIDRRSMLKRTGAVLGGLVALGATSNPLQFVLAQAETPQPTGAPAAPDAAEARGAADPASLPTPSALASPPPTTSSRKSRRSSRASPSTT